MCAGCVYLYREYKCLSALYATVCLCLCADSLLWSQSAKTEMLATSLDFIEMRESDKGSKTSDMQKLIGILAPINSETGGFDSSHGVNHY